MRGRHEERLIRPLDRTETEEMEGPGAGEERTFVRRTNCVPFCVTLTERNARPNAVKNAALKDGTRGV